MHRFYPGIAGLLLVAALALPALAPRAFPARDHYRPGDWVSYGVNRYVSSVAASPEQAFFGTTTGIARFDILRGIWQPPYTTSDGLADNRIIAVGFDHITSTLWCATVKGLSRQHPASLRWTNFSKMEIGVGENEDFVSLGFDNTSNWFQTSSGRLFRQDKFGNFFQPAGGQVPEESVVWFGERSPRPRPFPHFLMPPGYLFDPRGVVQDRHLRQARVTGVSRDRWGNMWLGTWGLGALRVDLNADQAQLISTGLASERVDALLFDEHGLWIGGLRNTLRQPADESLEGITYWRNPRAGTSDNRDWRYYDARYNFSMSSDEVNSFAHDGRLLYCATENGINIYDPQKDRWQRLLSLDGLASPRVNDLAIYGQYLYAATDLGLNRITLATIGRDSLGIAEVLPDMLRHVRIHDLDRQENLLWVASDHGPLVYDMATDNGGFIEIENGPGRIVTTAVSCYDSLVWFGTDWGVEALDVVHRQWLATPARNTLGGAAIHALVAGPEVVWAGTNNGAFKYHPRRREWKHYTREDGLLDDHVNAIALERELVWFGTDLGVTVFRWQAFHGFE
ncbi:MAG: hypothetical protein ONB48_02690 [candidate division KSB1 bacterium]|nr:hypothetical protein [candidate division KSB1 bacterium]MDZ7275748.1 hypothetical protein [candidate division KSB1 bacterium]MDZ7284561.1 hypothetical protein [candidate division KSB1 bacterium]MDZ7298020.1 hypothetical protein [candidate division KSB1 bacterium]MDZ7307735.1 hypothetical protein [candidate division KSB1 bacterium]